MSVALLTAARDAALTALDSGEYVEARKQALKALMVLSTIPDSSIASVSSQSWSRNSIEQFMSGLDQLEAAEAAEDGCSISSCSIEFSTRCDDGDCCSC